MAGGALYDNLDYSFTPKSPRGEAPVAPPTPGGGGPELRRQLTILQKFFARLDFVRMHLAHGLLTAKNQVTASARVLADPGRLYAAYIHSPDAATLALELPAGRYSPEWTTCKTGETDPRRNRPPRRRADPADPALRRGHRAPAGPAVRHSELVQNCKSHSTQTKEPREPLLLTEKRGRVTMSVGGAIMAYEEHCFRDPNICGGEVVSKGTQVTLRTVLASLAAGDTAAALLQDFPTLTEEHLRAAIAFAAASAAEGSCPLDRSHGSTETVKPARLQTLKPPGQDSFVAGACWRAFSIPKSFCAANTRKPSSRDRPIR